MTKKTFQTQESSRKFTNSPITKQGYPPCQTSSILIIRIDESFNNEHLQNNHLVLNMWPRTSQNL